MWTLSHRSGEILDYSTVDCLGQVVFSNLVWGSFWLHSPRCRERRRILPLILKNPLMEHLIQQWVMLRSQQQSLLYSSLLTAAEKTLVCGLGLIVLLVFHFSPMLNEDQGYALLPARLLANKCGQQAWVLGVGPAEKLQLLLPPSMWVACLSVWSCVPFQSTSWLTELPSISNFLKPLFVLNADMNRTQNKTT